METRSLGPTSAAQAGQSGQSETDPVCKGWEVPHDAGARRNLQRSLPRSQQGAAGRCAAKLPGGWPSRCRTTARGRVPKLAPATWPRLKVKNAAGKQKCVRGDSGGNGGKGDGAEASLERPQLAFPWLSKFSSNLNSRLSFGADYTDSHAPKKSRTEQKRETALRRPSRTIRRTHARERAEEAGLRGLNRFGRNPTAVATPSLRRCAPTPTADSTCQTYQSVSLPQITDRDQIVSERSANLRAVEVHGARR